jgi:hypothetical protein
VADGVCEDAAWGVPAAFDRPCGGAAAALSGMPRDEVVRGDRCDRPRSEERQQVPARRELVAVERARRELADLDERALGVQPVGRDGLEARSLSIAHARRRSALADIGDEPSRKAPGLHDADVTEALPARGPAAGRGGAGVEGRAVSIETALDADAVTRHESSWREGMGSSPLCTTP